MPYLATPLAHPQLLAAALSRAAGGQRTQLRNAPRRSHRLYHVRVPVELHSCNSRR